MTTGQELLLGIARDLNDAEAGHEFTKWTRQQLLDYLNEGLLLASIFKPDMFSDTVVLQLQPGSEQEACGCFSIKNIIGQTDEYGKLLGGYLPKRSMAAQFNWTKPGCPAPAGTTFRLTGYWSNAMTGFNTFSVTPPVPDNPPVYIKLECTKTPASLKISDLRGDIGYDRVIPAVRQWVLYRAMFVDDESVTASEAAQKHLALFFTLLQTQFKRELLAQLGISANTETKQALSILRAAGVLGGS